MKIRIVSISEHGPNFHVKATPLTKSQGDLLFLFPRDTSKATFHKPTEHRSEKDGSVTVKPAILRDSHIIALDTEEGGHFEVVLPEAKTHDGTVLHEAQSGEYELALTPSN